MLLSILDNSPFVLADDSGAARLVRHNWCSQRDFSVANRARFKIPKRVLNAVLVCLGNVVLPLQNHTAALRRRDLL